MKSPDTALKLLALALLGAVVAASSTLLGADIFTDTNEFEAAFSCLARIMHKFSTASPKSLVLTVLRDPQAGHAPCQAGAFGAS